MDCKITGQKDAPTECTDIDGNVYKTIKLGKQVWMAENLKTTHYREGTAIVNPTYATAWEELFVGAIGTTEWGALLTGAFCGYDNNPSNVSTYSRLYNWCAVDDVHGLAPEGWHVPTDEEWKELEMYLWLCSADTCSSGVFKQSNEGSQLAGDASLWIDGYLETNLEFSMGGFIAIPAGGRFLETGVFSGVSSKAGFWTVSQDDIVDAWIRNIYFMSTLVHRESYNKHSGMSVRCVKDAE